MFHPVFLAHSEHHFNKILHQKQESEEHPCTDYICLRRKLRRQCDNASSADYMISIHQNSYPEAEISGLKDKVTGIEAKADKRPIYKLAAPEFLELPNVGTAKEFDLETCASLSPELVILPMKLKDAAQSLSEMHS